MDKIVLIEELKKRIPSVKIEVDAKRIQVLFSGTDALHTFLDRLPGDCLARCRVLILVPNPGSRQPRTLCGFRLLRRDLVAILKVLRGDSIS